MTENGSADAGALLTRLRRIEGQVRGIHRMLEEGRMSEDVLTQLMAVRSGIDQVGLHIIDLNIEQCLVSDIPTDAGLRNLQKTLRLWLRFGGPIAPSD